MKPKDVIKKAHRFAEPFRITNGKKFRLKNFGSEQEFDKMRILGRFLDDDEFGACRGHALNLQQQVA